MPQTATVVSAAMVSPRDKLIELSISNREFGYLPGQFVMLSIPGIGEAPFSLASLRQKQGSFETIIRNVGKVTSALHTLAAGDTLGIRGPFGTHFPLQESFGKDLVILGSDIGLSPLRSAIGFVLENRNLFSKVFLFYGLGGDLNRLLASDLGSWKNSSSINFCETDPSNYADLSPLRATINTRIDPDNATAILAGQGDICKRAINELRSLGVSDTNIFLSLERRMKCGVGKCGHCQINDVHVCLDGPVFSLSTVSRLWEAL
jgi:NAD(P)H-flavin reductase